MKRKIQCLCILSVLLLTMSGCGTAVTEKASGESASQSSAEQMQVIPTESDGKTELAATDTEVESLLPLVWETEEDTNLAGLLQGQGKRAMVSMEAAGLRGSGMIYDVYESRMLIITAAHVLAKAPEVIIVQFSNGEEVFCRDYRVYNETDLAILSVDCSKLSAAAIRKLLMDDTKFETCKAGDTCIAMGGSEIPGDEAYEGKILQAVTYVSDYDCNMTLAAGVCHPGMSGGGLFDSRGYLLGLLSGFDAEDRIAVVPLPVIQEKVHSFLNNGS